MGWLRRRKTRRRATTQALAAGEKCGIKNEPRKVATRHLQQKSGLFKTNSTDSE
jgi:hypothetical protein